MKKLKNGFLALALIAGVSVAVISKVQALPKPNDPTYNWTHFDRSGHVIGLLNNATVATAESTFGCSSTGPVCATATGAPTIKYTP